MQWITYADLLNAQRKNFKLLFDHNFLISLRLHARRSVRKQLVWFAEMEKFSPFAYNLREDGVVNWI